MLVLALLVSLLSVSTSLANVEPDESDYRGQARVARISLLSGDVQLRRAGSREWESAAVNVPLVEGDQLATGKDARLEIQIDAYNFVRLDADSLLTIVTLRQEGVALSLAEGTATLRLSRFDKDREYFEIDAPKTTVAAEKRGLYRVDAGRNRSETSDVRITVRDGGRARIYSETSGFTLRDGRTARLFFDGTEGGDWELTSASSLDAWDEWIDQREYYLAQRLRYEQRERYYDSGVWGAEELDAYGDWVNAGSYGYVWRPHVTIINNYYNWTPYRYGYWRWCPPYGWTWIAYEPWGWAPYHYGRWVYYNGNWCWSPRSYHNYGYSWWHPALVVFVNVNNSYGNQICWYPLPHNQPNPVYPNRVKVAQTNAGPPPKVADPPNPGPGPKGDQALANIKGNVRPPLADPAYLNAVTSVPVKDFGMTKSVNKPAPLALAQTVIKSDPVTLDSLPVKTPQATGGGNSIDKNGAMGTGRPRGRDGVGSPGASLTEQPTGAAVRKPGVALDNELRTRLNNGRDPVSKQETGSGTRDDKTTGDAVRPARPFGKPTTVQPVEKSDADNAPVVRPTRPNAPLNGGDAGQSSTGTQSQPVRPVRQPPVQEQDIYSAPKSETPRPRQPEPQQQQPEPVREPVRQPRQPPPEPPQHSEPPPRYDPPPRNDPPPQQSAPPPKQESPPPPPQKSPDAPLGGGKRGTR
jgi:hypothetical protein